MRIRRSIPHALHVMRHLDLKAGVYHVPRVHVDIRQTEIFKAAEPLPTRFIFQSVVVPHRAVVDLFTSLTKMLHTDSPHHTLPL